VLRSLRRNRPADRHLPGGRELAWSAAM